MNFNLVIQGIIEIILAVLSGILIYFASLKAFALFTKGIDEEKEFKENNVAVSILISSFVFGIMLLIKESIGPSMENLSYALSADKITAGAIGYSVLKILCIYLASAVISFIFLIIAIKFFMILTTKIDEIREIKKNNVAVAIMIGVLTVSIAMVTMAPLKTLLKCLVSAPVLTGDFKEPLINITYLYQGLIEIGISLVAAVLVFLYSFKLYDMTTKKIDEMKELKANNIAISIQVSSFIFSIMIIVKASLLPTFDALEKVMTGQKIAAGIIIITILKIILFFVLAAAIAFGILWLVMKCFVYFNRSIDQMAEIKNRNISVAIAIAVLLISAALLLQHGVVTFLSSMV